MHHGARASRQDFEAAEWPRPGVVEASTNGPTITMVTRWASNLSLAISKSTREMQGMVRQASDFVAIFIHFVRARDL